MFLLRCSHVGSSVRTEPLRSLDRDPPSSAVSLQYPFEPFITSSDFKTYSQARRYLTPKSNPVLKVNTGTDHAEENWDRAIVSEIYLMVQGCFWTGEGVGGLDGHDGSAVNRISIDTIGHGSIPRSIPDQGFNAEVKALPLTRVI